VGFITESQPKFEEGDKRYQDILVLASEIISRTFEDRTGYLADMSDANLVQTFLRMDGELGFMRMLRSLHSVDNEISSNRNVILIFSDKDTLEVKTYRDATDALRALFELEAANPGKDIVLVRGDRGEDVREAFKNYFSDARQFIEFIDEGCQRLAGDRVQRA
jgi:putative GTP pyrophosphokinase